MTSIGFPGAAADSSNSSEFSSRGVEPTSSKYVWTHRDVPTTPAGGPNPAFPRHIVWDDSDSAAQSSVSSNASSGSHSHNRYVVSLGDVSVLSGKSERSALRSGRGGLASLSRVGAASTANKTFQNASGELVAQRLSDIIPLSDSRRTRQHHQSKTATGDLADDSGEASDISNGSSSSFTIGMNKLTAQPQTPCQAASSDLQNLPSVGSALHYEEKCRPCRHFGVKAGCRNGYACPFCHLPHDSMSWGKLPSALREQVRQLVLHSHNAETEEEKREADAQLLVVANGDARVTHYATVLLKALRDGKISKFRQKKGTGANKEGEAVVTSSAMMALADANFFSSTPASSAAPSSEWTRVSL